MEKISSPFYEEKPSYLAFNLEPDSTVLVVTDVQYASGSRHAGIGRERSGKGKGDLLRWRFDRIEQLVTPNIKRLLSFFREKKLRILYLTVGSVMPDYSDAPAYMKETFRRATNFEGSRDHEILDEIKPVEGEYVLNKTTRGAFNSTGIDSLLRSFAAKYLLFTGISTDQCVESTIRDAVDRDYRCVLIEDACAGTEEEFHRVSALHHQKYWGRVASTDEVIKELSALSK